MTGSAPTEALDRASPTRQPPAGFFKLGANAAEGRQNQRAREHADGFLMPVFHRMRWWV